MTSKKHYFVALGLIVTLVVYLAYYYHSIGTMNTQLRTPELYESTLTNYAAKNSTDVSQEMSKTQKVQSQTHDKNNTKVIVGNGIPTRLLYVSGYSESHSELCPILGTKLKLFIFITSAPNHFESRQAIRLTWGHYNMRIDVKMAFMVGITSNYILNTNITDEDAIYGDIVRGRFVDTYTNLTLKSISMLEWIDEYCPHVNFLLKTDDDMFINVDNLLKLINANTNTTRTIFGRLVKSWTPVRNTNSPYYLSRQEYTPNVFPDFMTGPAYLLTHDCIRDLYVSALDRDYLKLEDVFITGIVAGKLNIKQKFDPTFFNMKVTEPCKVQKSISIHMVKFNEQFDLWKNMFDSDAYNTLHHSCSL